MASSLHFLTAGIAFFLVGCSQNQTAPATTAQLLQQPNVVVLDVRTPAEFANGHLRNARNLDYNGSGFSTQVADLDTAKTYVLYCGSGVRSGKAVTLMQQQGFRKVINAGGFKTLQESGLKTE
ncbi:MAG TPA: rhodanese-like domain-containing protein [Hymenobacter sp.]